MCGVGCGGGGIVGGGGGGGGLVSSRWDAVITSGYLSSKTQTHTHIHTE